MCASVKKRRIQRTDLSRLPLAKTFLPATCKLCNPATLARQPGKKVCHASPIPLFPIWEVPRPAAILLST